MTNLEQIDIKTSLARNMAILIVAVGGLALCIAFLATRPEEVDPSSLIRGGVSEFAIIAGIIIFSFYVVAITKDFFASNVIVSIGEKGIFDRRVSTDWVPWTAIRNVSIVDRKSQKNLLFKICSSERGAEFLRKNNNVVGSSASGSPQEFYVGTGTLKGGFTAVHNAVTNFYQIPTEGRVH